jgi:hypothetical protein
MKIIRIAQNANSIDIHGTNLTVYHRTKDQDIAGNICTIGFIAGGGAAYGRGIYTTYDLKSSLRNANLKTYGGEIVKAVVNINGFLIFDYDIAQQVYGANYRLTDQIKNIIGESKIINGSLNRKKQWNELERVSKALNSAKWTSDHAYNISHRFSLVNNGINGILFNGRQDGKVCVAFKELLVTPLAHAWIDGKTYKNPTWTDCGKRTTEEFQKLQQDEKQAEGFRRSRKQLLDDLGRFSDKGRINIDPKNYPNIPEGIFDSALANFLYEDEKRIERLSPTLRTRLKDVIEVEFMIRKLKSAPTVFWNQWKKLDPAIKAKIPNSLLIEIWENFILSNPGYWEKIPDGIRPAINKDKEGEYWATLIKKNDTNWKHIHPEIVEYIQDTFGLNPPSDIEEQRKEAKEEMVSETEEIDIPISALGWVQNNISKLNKRAGRLGLRPITHEVISEDPKNRTQKIKIVGNVPYIKGWKLIARVQQLEDDSGNPYNAIETLSDEGLPDGMDLENASMDCNHCGHNRKRKECYIVKNENADDPKYQKGQFLMIGSTCLGDFVGDLGGKSSPESIAKYAQQFKQMLTLFKEGNIYQNKSDDDIRKDFKNKGVPIVFFLTKVMQLERQFGMVGRRKAVDTGKAATADLAWDMCINLNTDKKYSQGVDATDLATIYSALDWIKSLPESIEQYDEFLYKIKKSCELGTVFSKKRNGNIGLVAWLPSQYQQKSKEQVNYEKVYGEVGEEIFFKGTVISKKPVLTQVSQQVIQGKNIIRDYIIAQSDARRMVAWLEDAPIQADMNQIINLKGKVAGNLNISGETASILDNVEEISDQDYANVEPQVEKRLQELSSKQKPQPSAIPGSPQGNYQDGAQITEKYEIIKRKRYGKDDLFGLVDSYGQNILTFTNLDLGQVGDIVVLNGTVKFNKGFTNLINVSIADKNGIAPQVQPQAKASTDYQDGEKIEDDFTIQNISPARYGDRYDLVDSVGRRVTTFPKYPLGNIGDTVRLQATIKLKDYNGRTYANLQRIKVMPRQTQTPSKPTQQITTPKIQTQQPTNNLPVQPTGTQPQQDDDTMAGSFNWYRLNKQAGIFDKFKPSNWFSGQRSEQPAQPKEDEVIDPQQPQNSQQDPLYKEPHEVDLDNAYTMFADSYEKTTGKAWEKNKFLNRASNWIFFGDEYGYIAVRPQRSGLYKLVGIAGDDNNPTKKGRSLIKAFNDLMAEGKPTWGMVSQELKGMAERMGLKSPHSMFIKQFIKYIPSQIFGGAKIKNIFPDGGIEFEYNDVGSATKYFIANDAYFNWLKAGIDSNQNMPGPAKFLLKKVLDRIAKSRAFVKTAMVGSFSLVRSNIDLSEV